MARKKLPDVAQPEKQMPDTTQTTRAKQSPAMENKAVPPVGNPENTVMIGGSPYEIKPTKLKYQRNRVAMFYKILDLYPLADILAMDAGQFGDDRDGDKCVMDWLIAATDNEELITAHYDQLDTGTIEKILLIFKRVNKIDEKDAKLKNREISRKEAE